MHAVQSPEQGKSMKHDMLKVYCCIQYQHSNYNFKRYAKVKLVKYTELVCAGVLSDTHCGSWEYDSQNQGV